METAKGRHTGLEILREENVSKTRPHRAPFVIVRCARCHRFRYAKVRQKKVYCYGCEKAFSLGTKKSPLKVMGFANTARQASDVIRDMKEGHYVEKRLRRSIDGPL